MTIPDSPPPPLARGADKRYVVRYSKRGKLLAAFPDEHPKIDPDLINEFKQGRWKKIVVETWHLEGDRYVLAYTIKVTPTPKSSTQEAEVYRPGVTE